MNNFLISCWNTGRGQSRQYSTVFLSLQLELQRAFDSNTLSLPTWSSTAFMYEDMMLYGKRTMISVIS